MQPKAITFPTDAKLLHAAIQRLASPRAEYDCDSPICAFAKRAAMMAERYAYAKQFNQHHHQLRFLRIRNRKRLSSSFVIAITSSGCRRARARIPWVLLDTDDTKPMGKRHRHDTEGM